MSNAMWAAHLQSFSRQRCRQAQDHGRKFHTETGNLRNCTREKKALLNMSMCRISTFPNQPSPLKRNTLSTTGSRSWPTAEGWGEYSSGFQCSPSLTGFPASNLGDTVPEKGAKSRVCKLLPYTRIKYCTFYATHSTHKVRLFLKVHIEQLACRREGKYNFQQKTCLLLVFLAIQNKPWKK